MPGDILGKVFLVGAGPGDPDLLTVKAARLIEQADVIVYDRLVSEAIFDLVPSGTMRIYVGKATAQHHRSQDETNDLLVSLAKIKRRVVRLKGGDPFIFGRGSEEAAHLARHGIAFEVVPGITAASACGASAGIPLTHRGFATGVRFVTGHCCDNGKLDLNWSCLADPDTTLVFYMALANLPEISARLQEAGLSRETPAAAIANGTLPDQRIVYGTLSDLPEKVAQQGLCAPSLIFIGQVVELADIIGARDRYLEAEPNAGLG